MSNDLKKNVLVWGYVAGITLSFLGMIASAVYLYVFIRRGLESGDMTDSLHLLGLTAERRLSLLSTAIFVGMSFGFLGFALFLIQARGDLDVEASTGDYKIKLARLSPGLFVILCATVIIVVAATTKIDYQLTRDDASFAGSSAPVAVQARGNTQPPASGTGPVNSPSLAGNAPSAGTGAAPQFRSEVLAYHGKSMFISVPGGLEEPYSHEESERLRARRVPLGEEGRAERIFRPLSPTHSILIRSPFILIEGPGPTPPEFRQQQTTANQVQVGALSKLEDLYSRVIRPTVEHMRPYFSRFPEQYVPIFVFGEPFDSSYDAFNAYCKEIHFRPAGERVSYQCMEDNSLMVWVSSGTGTLVHELVHALMEPDFPGAPEWLAEGMASLHEELDADFAPSDNYRLIYLHSAHVRFGRLQPVEQLVGLSVTEFRSGYLRLNTAHARYLCYFLLEKGLLQEVYARTRSLAAPDARLQLEIVLAALELDSSESLQQVWTEWVLARGVPEYWQASSHEIEREIGDLEMPGW
ncbi:MAG: hypothetical protein ABL998_18480 [Planctomycetota bacterium]